MAEARPIPEPAPVMRETLSDRIPDILSSLLPLNTYPLVVGPAKFWLPESGFS
jgi:hypothetical protein